MTNRLLPYAKVFVFTCVVLGSAFTLIRSMRPGASPLAMPSAIQNLLPDAMGATADEAIEIATAEMTRVYSLQQRPPVGGESLGKTSDDRFWMISLDLGEKRSRILCVVEPEARDAKRRLVHFALAAREPDQAFVERVASQGLRKASVTGSVWSWREGATGGSAGRLLGLTVAG